MGTILSRLAAETQECPTAIRALKMILGFTFSVVGIPPRRAASIRAELFGFALILNFDFRAALFANGNAAICDTPTPTTKCFDGVYGN